MKIVYVPVFKMAVNYAVSVGRRWTILEHTILIELSKEKRSSTELSELCALPRRIVIEALIKLLQANWIDLRASNNSVVFTATEAGRKRANEHQLPVQLSRDIRWTSLCFERMTGSWFRSDDVTLVYERDLPEDANILPASYSTVNLSDGNINSLLYVQRDETLEQEPPRFTRPSQPYMRVAVSFEKLELLPDYAPLRLQQEILDFCVNVSEETPSNGYGIKTAIGSSLKDTITADDIHVGGDQNYELIKSCLQGASSTVIIHSCFVHPKVIERLLPEFEKAAKRKVRIDLLWGLHRDPESTENPAPIKESELVLDRLGPTLRSRVKLSSMSSGSHCKVIVYDDAKSGAWHTVVSSCNFLSSWYTAHDVSVRLKSQQLASRVVGWLIAAQQPASGAWPATARRLDRAWDKIREASAVRPEQGVHSLSLLVDLDHYACVRHARDRSRKRILLGCDLYGLAAETSAIVPLETAASKGKEVRIFYQRPSRALVSEGREPDHEAIAARGIKAERVTELHGKFLMWDDEDIVATSFNWLSTTVDGSRQTGAELGVWISGPNIQHEFRQKAKLNSAFEHISSHATL